MKLSSLSNGSFVLPVLFVFFSFLVNGNDKLYGQLVTTVIHILEGMKEYPLDKHGARGGTGSFDQFTVIEMPNFMEYLRSGWFINLSCAIDFTASNKDVEMPDSLH